MNVYIFESYEQDKVEHSVEITCYDSDEWYALDKVNEYFDRLFNEDKITEFFKTSYNYVNISRPRAKVHTFYAHSYYEIVNKLYNLGISDISTYSPEGYDKIYADNMSAFFDRINNS